MDRVWIDQGSLGKPMTDARVMPTTLDHAELKEVYFLCTFWDVVGTHYLQVRTVG